MSQPIIQMKNVIKEFTVGGGFAKERLFERCKASVLIFTQGEHWLSLANQAAVKARVQG